MVKRFKNHIELQIVIILYKHKTSKKTKTLQVFPRLSFQIEIPAFRNPCTSINLKCIIYAANINKKKSNKQMNASAAN